jgi:hypothetical protein
MQFVQASNMYPDFDTLTYPPQILEQRHTRRVKVTMVLDGPKLFVVHLLENENQMAVIREKLRQITVDMTLSERPMTVSLTRNTPCLAYSTELRSWLRGMIKQTSLSVYQVRKFG